MDTQFTDEELAFQAEVRHFFADVIDENLRTKLAGAEASPSIKEDMLEYQRRLNARAGWPQAGRLSTVARTGA